MITILIIAIFALSITLSLRNLHSCSKNYNKTKTDNLKEILIFKEIFSNNYHFVYDEIN